MILKVLLGLLATMTLASCGGGTGSVGATVPKGLTYRLAGSVTGLPAGTSVTLSDGLATTTISTDAAFSLGGVPPNASYAVTVVHQPTGVVCTVNKGIGAGIDSNVTGISVVCSAVKFTVGGSLDGLATGASLTISNSTGEHLPLTANGPFTFSTPIADNGSYAVTVSAQPSGEICTVSRGTGSGMVANVSNVRITCATDTYPVRGTISGLSAGQQVTILDNSADPITATANGAFAFSIPIAYSGSYAVTVGTQPAGETCTVTNGTGRLVTATVPGISVVCSGNTYTVAGAVSGLAAGAQLTLQNNHADALTIHSDGTFVFATPIAWGSNFDVTVSTQAVGQTCSVGAGSGNNVTADITTVSVTCANNVTANPGSPVTTFVPGPAVTLDASGSSSLNGAPLTYSWSLSSAPAGSTASLSSTTAVKPSFVPDVVGTYVLDLTVSDGNSSATSTVTVTATSLASQFSVGHSSSVKVLNGVYQAGSEFACTITNTSSYALNVSQFLFEALSATGSATPISTITTTGITGPDTAISWTNSGNSAALLGGGVIGSGQSITIVERLNAAVPASSWKGLYTVGYPAASSTQTIGCTW